MFLLLPREPLSRNVHLWNSPVTDSASTFSSGILASRPVGNKFDFICLVIYLTMDILLEEQKVSLYFFNFSSVFFRLLVFVLKVVRAFSSPVFWPVG